jgi:membrane-bound serine protease (ClpP class)
MLLWIYVGGLGLVFLEIFVPGGLLGVAGGLCLVFVVTTLFLKQGLLWGAGSLALTLGLVPLLIRYGANRIALRSSLSKEEGYVAFRQDELSKLIGQEGTAFTPLRPSGEVLIGKNKVDAVAALGMIEKDIPVRVTGVRGYSVIVERAQQTTDSATSTTMERRNT